jgi:hypothetical protein
MLGQYVRMLVVRYARGIVKAARFHGGVVRYLFQPHIRLANTFPDVQLLDCELEECARASHLICPLGPSAREAS